MRLKTSFFNATVYKKNLTRFAPVWGLYTLCLILGTLLIYSNGGTMKQFHFAANMAEMPQYMGLINLIYAPIVVQLLFGDLYSSRMCNALHAMPLRRESWFFTNILSGLTFSIVPTLVMAVFSMFLCMGSIIRGAWQIPWLVFAAANLEYICFFGIALFSALCVGSRLSMVLIYGVLNAGACIAYWLINTIYTPMLYGVVTPDALVEALTPIAHILDNCFIETDQLYDLREIFGDKLEGAVGAFEVTEYWPVLYVWTAVGIGFALIALVLYKKRDLECAGDAMAFKLLEPVFQVLGAVVTAAAAQFFISEFLGFYDQYHYIFLASGLVIGWFACRMLIERSTRVFRLKNWAGLMGLTAVIAVSLFLTHVDILGIETWQPKAENVKSVTLSYNHELTDKADIQKLLNLQAEALDTRLEESGAYIQDENGQWVRFSENIDTPVELTEWHDVDCRYAYYTSITYTLQNGKEVTRRYPIWFDGQAADDARSILSRWEIVNNHNDTVYINGRETEIPILDEVMASLETLYVEGVDKVVEGIDRAMAEELIAAIQADCDAGNMAQVRYLHGGHFRKANPEKEGDYRYRPSLYVSLDGKNYGWGVDIYPECENTLRWLKTHDLLTYDVMENSLCFY